MRAPSSTIDDPWRERGLEGLSYGLLLLVIAPNLVWILLDRGLWTSDAAYYGLSALRLNHAWEGGLSSSWSAMISVVPKPPILPWTGQFLVPLGQVLGHMESGLLCAAFAAQCLALVLLYRTFGELTQNRAIALVGCLSVAASPVFTGISKQFYVQPVQLAAVTWFLFIMVGSRRWDSLKTLLHLIAASSFALLTTLSSPPMCLLPGVVALWFAAIRMRRGVRFEPSHAFLVVLATGLAAPTFAWYQANAVEALNHARWAYGYVYSGTLSDGYLLRFVTWLYFAFVGLMPVAPVILALLAAGLYFTLARQSRTDDWFTLLAAICLLQIGLVLALFSNSANQESRYVLALAPYLAFAMVWTLSRVGKRWVTVAVALVLAFELLGSQLTDFGVSPIDVVRYGRALQLEPGRDLEVMQSVADLTRHEPGPHLLATHQIGFHSLQLSFEAAKDPGYDRESDMDVDQVEFILTRDGVQGDAGKAWSYVLAMKPTYVVLADRELQRQKMEESNSGWRLVLEGTLAVSRQVAQSDGYERVPTPGYPEIEVYRRVNRD